MYARQNLVVRVMFAFALVTMVLGATAPASWAAGNSGAVYVGTNQPAGNAVIVFHRAADGSLSSGSSFQTGGNGLGTGADPLGSQGAVVLNQSNQLLLAVNAGSNDVSLFEVTSDGLHLADKVSSGGTTPISVTVYGNFVYVLNSGGTPNIAGFVIDPRTSHLVPLAGSTRNLAGGAAATPAEVSFSLDGSLLMVTEKGTQTIDTYTVSEDGYASGPVSSHSSGASPFGFAFSHRDLAIVSEAGPNALSSYGAQQNGALDLVTGSLGDGQAATCWAIVTGDGRYAYSVNAGSGTISSYSVSPQGNLTLLSATAGTTGTGSAPTDPALSNDSSFLYLRDGGLNEVHGFRVEANGSLIPVGTIGGIPAGSQGIAAH